MRFFDPDHHLIEIGESVPTFVKSMFNDEKKNLKEIHEKTGIPIPLIKEYLDN